MATNRKPKKKYRPKPIYVDTMTYVKVGLAPPAQKFRTRIEIINHSAMHQLTHGKGTLSDWQEVAMALNTALVLAEDFGIGADLLTDFNAALEAHRMCGARRFGYLGPELSAVNHALSLHEQQMGIATTAEHEKAMKKVINNVYKEGKDIKCA